MLLRNSKPASNLINWARYSGVSIIFTLNPLHWRWVPVIRCEKTLEWPSPNEHTYMIGWVFLTIRMWIDDGSW
jgi:hypothetical protein